MQSLFIFTVFILSLLGQTLGAPVPLDRELHSRDLQAVDNLL